MSERLYPKPPRPKKDRSYRRYKVDYELMILERGGAASWESYFRYRWMAVTAAWWNQHVATYGGVVTLIDQWKETGNE